MINKNTLLSVFSAIALIALGSLSASAFSPNKYAKTSKLATGNWVKIQIPEDGIYQITYDELAEMGFSSPQNVKIFGTGGHPISEILDGSATDDLKQIPIKHFGGEKICFYGCGPVEYSIDTTNTTPHYIRSFNSYSQAGYYFITDDNSYNNLEPAQISSATIGKNVISNSLDYSHHEEELTSPSQSGKEMLGENFINGSITLPYYLPGVCSDSAIVVNPCVGAKGKNLTTITTKVNDEDVSLSIGINKIYGSTSYYVFYNSASPAGIFSTASGIPENGEITFGLSVPVIWARLNYFIITYKHHNTITDSEHNQLRMGLYKITTSDIITISDATSETQLWNIDNPQRPLSVSLTSIDDGIAGFTPTRDFDWKQYIAFTPDKELKSISGFETVENQNIHGMETPHMVIVTRDNLLPQAERIAQMHRDNDNMIVHVIDQQKIFNEFSSGTPDGMAIRLMNKMFYDRDSNKFKYMLMFGAGNYDNRQLFAKHDCAILTYESNNSNDENSSYVSDDFFGMLEDNSGKNPAGELLMISVGRIPCATLEEAESDVDKLINYVNNPDYGPWRNNALFIADYVFSDPDEKYMHAVQAEGIGNLINDELNVNLMKNKVYVTQFPKDPTTGFWLEGRRSMNSQLNEGQYFMTYVGHANPSTLTKEVNMWTANEAKNAAYPHLPIVTTACCDVARYDGSQRGLMEIMFHKPDGGVIAMVGATRAAYSNGNDALNQAFVRAMFCYNTKGYMPTLGEAYMLSKQSFGTYANYNKMMFSLFGDPAMKVNYPKPYFKITKINGYTASTSNISSGALQQVTVEAKVYTPDGSAVDQSFNGDATLSIYDYKKIETTYNSQDIYHPRKLLTQVKGRVVNGVFTGKAVIPRYTQYPGRTGLVSVYAHRDNSDEMVSGMFDKLVLNKYSPTNALTIHDDTPPVIEAIYFNNDQEFEQCNVTGTTSTLHIRATDDYSFNTQNLAIGNGMDLKLDNGKTSLFDAKSYAIMNNDGKSLEVNMPLTLDPGNHTLSYTVYDAAGNRASKNFNFTVEEQHLSLTVEQEPAVDMATFNIDTNLPGNPQVEIKVFNHLGDLRWRTTTSDFPFDWNLIGTNGRKLPPGIYTFYGRYKDGNTFGGTTKGTLVVADEVHSK